MGPQELRMTMYSQNSQGERISAKACSTCHKKKIRCDKQPGTDTCSNCYVANVICRPHERKRKRDHRDRSRSPLRKGAYVNPSSKPAPLWNPAQRQHTTSYTQQASDAQPNSEHQQVDGTPSVNPPRSYLGRAEYISGVVPIDEDDARMYPQDYPQDVPEHDMQYLRDIGAFDLPSRAMRSSLIESFMERCAPWMPIVNRDELEGPKPSILLLQAVFAAGSRVSTASQLQDAGRAFYRRAKALFHMEIEKDPLTVIRAICILQWWNPSGPEHVSMNASSFWIHMGVALAHQVGLHREPNPKEARASLRRKLWWVLFVRDCMISLSHGRPRSICIEDCNVRRPTVDDFVTTQDAHLFMAYVEISSIVADITEASVRGTLGRCRRLSVETRLSDWIQNLPPDLSIYNQQTGKLAPYQFKARQLHLPYFTALVILYRPAVPGTILSPAAILASSFIAGIFEEFIARDEIGMLASTFIFHLLASAITELLCYQYPALWTKAEPELEILNQALIELTKRFPSGHGAQRVIRHATQTVKKETQSEDPPVFNETPEQFNFFRSFGPELCSKWDIVYGSRSENGIDRGAWNGASGQPHSSQSISDNKKHASNDQPQARQDTLEETQQHGSPDLTWATAPAELSNLEKVASSAFETDSAYYGSISRALDPIGNWMLADWITEVD
ncbi:fungal-specific transcription factor domain-containing protein [Xylogone sp. PMI_703]|nr:fungal-specific transcription factor domain-containing protein [Xylogone sp. PMI_703]